MKATTLFLLGLSILPLGTAAQSWTYGGSNEDGSVRTERIRSYRRESSEIQQRMSSLPAVANYQVYMPVLFGVTLKNISPNFGDPRSNGRTHEGEDVMAIKGTPIISPTAAVVIRVGNGPSEGNYVYTANPGGETFVYMHLDKIGEGIEEGVLINQGTLIGYVGDTGNAIGGPAHLHFEIHASSSEPMDPFPRLTLELSLQDKMSYLSAILSKASDADMLAQFLVQNFKSTFVSAKNAGISLPDKINTAFGSVATVTAPSTPVAPAPQLPGCPAGYVCRAISTTPTSTSSTPFTRDLKLGMNGEDVRTLQKMLNAQNFTIAAAGPGSLLNETTYFGPATQSALIKFQIAKKLSPTIGYFGPLSRSAIMGL